MLRSRFVTFHKALRSCSKFPVRFLARLFEEDLRTVHGRNLHEISRLCGLKSCDPERLQPSLVKKYVRYKEIPKEESWRIGLCEELLELRDKDSRCVPGFDDDELSSLLSFICVS